MASLEGAGFDFNKREKRVNGLDIIKAVGGVLNIFLNKRAVKILRREHLERPEKDFTEQGGSKMCFE